MEYTTKTIKGDGFTVNIHRPILTPEERAKQEKLVVETLKNIYRKEANRETNAS